MRWDVFCKVVDNYGDAGVCWRLARQLSAEHHQQVRLIIDHLPTLAALIGHALVLGERYEGVEVVSWSTLPSGVADVVVEAFACELPCEYQAAMKARVSPVQWLNLEYLSAEDWVEGCHGLVSKHPQLGLDKTFFFPGFTPLTGGLLRENGLLAQRQHSQRHQSLSHYFPALQPLAHETVVSLFAYPTASVSALLNAWADAKQSVLCLVPACRIQPQIEQLLGQGALVPYQRYAYGSVVVQRLPFMPQAVYDSLLWHCDLNFVRGEDSFVRAQWAGRPLVWQAYPQADDAHADKLAAFMQRYGANAGEWWQTVAGFWRVWNQVDTSASVDGAALLAALPSWRWHATQWADQLAQQTDLASQLVNWVHTRKLSVI